MQLPEWILEISFNIISSYLFVLFVVCTLWSAIYASSLPISLPLPFAHYLLPFFVGLRVIVKLDSYFFTHHALVLSHTAWLTGSWSACTELLITSTPHPLHPLATHTYTQNTISVWLGQVQSFFPLTAVNSVCWQRLQRRLHKEASYSMTAFPFSAHIPHKDTYKHTTHNHKP